MANTKISEMAAATTVGVTDVLPIVQGGVNKKATKEVLLGYKVYTALLTQTDQDPPIATVFENTIGAAVLDYSSEGIYRFVLSGAFPAAKTIVFSNTGSTIGSTKWSANGETVSLQSLNSAGTPTDGVLTNASIEIRVYP